MGSYKKISADEPHYLQNNSILNVNILNVNILNVNISNKKTHWRENKNKDMYLSDLAIKNLLEFYKNTDYQTLNILYEYNFIDKETLDSYYKYPII
jgi:hypothetical protein